MNRYLLIAQFEWISVLIDHHIVTFLLSCRLCVAVQDAEQLRTEKVALEEQIRELQAKSANLESETYDAVAKVQDCIQLLEEANLQKSQVSQVFLEIRIFRIHKLASFIKINHAQRANWDVTPHHSDLSYIIKFKAYVECLDQGNLSDNTVPKHESSKIFRRVQGFLPSTGVRKKKEGSVTNL